jgi:sugar transferase (PEP-CTERM/EpsH1 system associated)
MSLSRLEAIEGSPMEAWVGSRVAAASSRRLHVVQLLRSLNTGGQEVLCARLVERLDPDRFVSTVLALEDGGWLSRRLDERGFRVRCLGAPPGLQPGLVVRLARLLRKLKPDIVHCHNHKPILYGGLATLLLPKTRLVFTKHGASSWDGEALSGLSRYVVGRSHAVIAVSRDIAGPLLSGGWVRRDRLHTVLNGVDTDEFQRASASPALKSALGFSPEHRLVGTVARLSKEKDQAALLRAFADLRPRMPEARLLIVGDGTLRGDLERLSGELGIADRTLFVGEREDIADILASLDVFCLPSLTEGTSLTLLEAMATGLPVVATAVGGNPEIVRDGESGLLVPPRAPQRLADALVELLCDPARARAMGEIGREIVIERYSIRSMVEKHQAIYEAVCA